MPLAKTNNPENFKNRYNIGININIDINKKKLLVFKKSVILSKKVRSLILITMLFIKNFKNYSSHDRE